MPADGEEDRDRRYMLIDSASVRSGLAGITRGWLMGSFVETSDLRFSREFEVKEWDIQSMRRGWRDGTDCGTEYIAVLDGVLTVLLGRAGPDGQAIEVDSEIEVRPDHRIILAPGVWRSFRATENVKAITVRHCFRR